MKVFEDSDSLQMALHEVRRAGLQIGLVPTMGKLHEGHLSLVDAAGQQTDYVVATIFVNPLQFGPNEDIERYPRSLEEDRQQLSRRGCDALFIPAVSDIYPHGLAHQTKVVVPDLTTAHCGASRPGHFDGVATVVCKLFNLLAPAAAFFGLKDYQQVLVIRRMVSDLSIPVSIHGLPTKREANGLAMSSRNTFLSPQEKDRAAGLYACLQASAAAIAKGSDDFRRLEQDAMTRLTEGGMRVDYFNICQAQTLQPANRDDDALVILAAVFIGGTRLIDNITVNLAG
ncbi:MAG: pantoate--beta-alanine ligase [Pseudomonadales bacterium]|nr:pantoate--beta-alanine ligase [Pseudomonadales bacterium]